MFKRILVANRGEIALRIFQIVVAVVTLLVIVGYAYVGRKAQKTFSNSAIQASVAGRQKTGLSRIWRQLLIFGLTVLIFCLCLAGYLLLRQNPTLMLVILFIASLVLLTIPILLTIINLMRGGFDRFLPNLRGIDLSKADLSMVDLSKADLKQAQ